MPALKHAAALSPTLIPSASSIYWLKSPNVILAEKKSTKSIPTLKSQNPSAASSDMHPPTYSASIAKDKAHYVTYKVGNWRWGLLAIAQNIREFYLDV